MAILIFFLVAFCHSQSLPAFECGSMEVQPCILPHEVKGHVCRTDLNNSCLADKNWCLISAPPKIMEQCADHSNLMFDTCMAVDFTIDDIDYHVNIVQTTWTIAEQYCQSRKSHLIDFRDQTQYDKVLQKLLKISSEPEKVGIDPGFAVKDPLGQKCWEDLHQNVATPYWTGLFFDRYKSAWKLSSGGGISKNIASLSNSIDTVLAGYDSMTHTGHVMFLDKNFTFQSPEKSQNALKIDSPINRARIICKKSMNFKPWEALPKPENSGCITGFKCSGKHPKCITGAPFQNTDICNGIEDCPYGDDENTEECQEFSESFPDNFRSAVFLTVKRSAATVRLICEQKNMTLPSVTSEKDEDFLLSLPQKFASTRPSSDFLRLSQDWNATTTILLGVRRGAAFWDDNSPVYYKKKEIDNLMSMIQTFI